MNLYKRVQVSTKALLELKLHRSNYDSNPNRMSYWSRQLNECLKRSFVQE